MKILFAGGGTAGHIHPALAVAESIRALCPDAQISYIGTSRGLEDRLVREAGYAFYTIDIRGFRRKLTPKNVGENLRNVRRAFQASADAKRILTELRPDRVVGTGGYVSGPVLYAAAKLGLKTAIHEQNAFPGLTTRLLAGRADCVMLAMPEARRYLRPKNEPVITGNPVRPALLRHTKAEAREILGLDDRPVVLSFGGSLGARPLNDAVTGLLAREHGHGDRIFYHAAGKTGYADMRAQLDAAGVPADDPAVRVAAYFDRMDLLMPAADLLICRAGAITLSEIACCGKAAILVPSPHVAENHQLHNAMTLVSRGAAELLEEKDLTAERLIRQTEDLLGNPDRLREMGENAKRCAVPDASRRMAETVLAL